MPRYTILVAIGANLTDTEGRSPLQTCRWAVTQLHGIPGLRLLQSSRWYRSPAWPPSDQPDYVNGAARLSGEADPLELLHILHRIENQSGRRRTIPNAARTLDLDLLAVDDLVVDTPALTLPHPRLHQRAFVLAPLADIAPDWVHPRTGSSVAAMLAATDMTGVSLI